MTSDATMSRAVYRGYRDCHSPAHLQLVLAAAVAGSLACAQVTTPGGYAVTATPSTTQGDTAGRALVVPGFGSLRQDDVSLHVDGSSVLLRALPLDESLIRLLTPDSYRALHDLKESNRAAIEAIARRYGGRAVTVWLVSFYGVEPGARFAPGDVIVASSGRDFRPYDIIPLTVGFGEQRLRQRETQSALYLFDGDVQVDQPVTVTYQGVTDDTWEQTLQRVERERAMVRARSGKPD